MSISRFSHALQGLPALDDAVAYETFMECIFNKETMLSHATEFVEGMRKFAEGSPAINPRVLMVAYALSRFPINSFKNPDQPLELSLLSSANHLIGTINEVVAIHDSNGDLAPSAVRFLEDFDKYNTLYTEWRGVMLADLRQMVRAAVANTIQSMQAREEAVVEVVGGEE